MYSEKSTTSVSVAKQRLQQLLSADRINCSPGLIYQMKEDIYLTISKYMELDPTCFDIDLTRNQIHITYIGE